MEEKKALIEDLDLSGLFLGMTVYHPSVELEKYKEKLGE